MEEITLLNQIWRTALGMGLMQWLATIFSIAYVVLAAKESIWCWPIGLLGVICSFIVYIDPEVRLYSDATLQIYYFGMSIYGWMAWQNRNSKEEMGTEELEVSNWQMKQHLIAFAGGTLLALLLGYFWTWMNAALAYVDAFTTSFSIIATYMVARKVLENWLYWIVIDSVCIFVYWHRELYLFSFLFLVYCLVAVFGFMNWKKGMNK